MHVSIKDLPQSLRAALADLGYKRADVSIEAAETYSLLDYGSNGSRAFVCAVNLATGERSVTYGSWGGPNPFAAPPVDRDDTPRPIPPNAAIISGSEGGGRPVYASIKVAPATLAPMLPEAPALTAPEAGALYAHQCIKGGDYRRNELLRVGATSEVIDALVGRGLLARNRAGAVSITTAGKNARAAHEAAIRAKGRAA